MDPISLTASITGVATFADTVITRLYNYCKTVKDCEDEVRELLAEGNILSAVLNKLAQVVEENEEEEDEEEEEEDAATNVTSEIPRYITACHSVLNELNRILVGFERKASRQISNASKSKGTLSRLTPSDLKWPFSKSKTTELTERLSRYKGTCMLALATTELSGIKSILQQFETTKNELAEIKADGKILVEAQCTKEIREILDWFGPVNPALKHQEFRKEYQEGTGYWIFKTPEYRRWAELQNSGLWIYAIPGAGKTILASLIIETMSRTRTKGFAYFYCRHSDQESQKPQNVIGSLVSQLARQDQGALAAATTFYSKYHPSGQLETIPTPTELGELLQTLSAYFFEVTIVVDGLDEVGASLDVNRAELIQVLSNAHVLSRNSRTIILSRNETDIHESLKEFESVSIAATSEDLQLYVSAKIVSLPIKDTKLRTEVFDALIDGAEGMFFWTVCQIQLLQDLPTPALIRKALKSLPPGLPGTYVRIFEKMKSRYSDQVQILIQRALKWLVYGNRMTLEALAQAISLEDNTTSLCNEAIPEPESILGWFGCLLRNGDHGVVELAHYSIREFLVEPVMNIPSTLAGFRVQIKDQYYIAETACIYLALSNFDCGKEDISNADSLRTFRERFPFYEHLSNHFSFYLQQYSKDLEPHACLRLFTVTASKTFLFWMSFVARSMNTRYISEVIIRASTTPLHVACGYKMFTTAARLLLEGHDYCTGYSPSPLFFALTDAIRASSIFALGAHEHVSLQQVSDQNTPLVEGISTAKQRLFRTLLKSGNDVNDTLPCNIYSERERKDKNAKVSPLYISLAVKDLEITQLLLDHGALLICSIESLYDLMNSFACNGSTHWPGSWGSILERIIEQQRYDEVFLSVLLRHGKQRQDDMGPGENRVESACIIPDASLKGLEDPVIEAVQAGDVPATEFYLRRGSSIHVLDAEGRSLLMHSLLIGNPGIFKLLKNHGADIHAPEADGKTPMVKLCQQIKVRSLMHWLGDMRQIQFGGSELQEVFYFARTTRNIELLDFVAITIATQEERSLALTTMDIDNLTRKKSLIDREKLLSCYLTKTDFSDHEGSEEDRVDTPKYPWEGPTDPCFICWMTAKASPKVLKHILEARSKRDTECCNEHLCIAAYRGDCSIVDVLLKHGEAPNRRNKTGRSPIHYATGFRDDFMSRLLDFNDLNSNGTFFYDNEREASNRTGIIELLGSHGADFYVKYKGQNAIHHAISCQYPDFEVLLKRGVPADLQDCSGQTPLLLACYTNFMEGIEKLLKLPDVVAKINEPSDIHGAPLHCASNNGYTAVVEKLLDAGALIDYQMMPGNYYGPALYAACARGHVDVVKLLLTRGASTNVRGPRYSSAMEVAQAFEELEVIEVLREHSSSREHGDEPEYTGPNQSETEQMAEPALV
ncbi:hypothetical protein BP6252_09680 [Coleophoma cylindrospora]|uniref:NACHT domain-containing protein n=1 Tax=Coleophoma cylindrospora TaxID=1849047 RepID=A0A3D8QW94_9HELO|nr:hypothetical protein BP6252_09680 [Coleophoma cylindrospora]